MAFDVDAVLVRVLQEHTPEMPTRPPANPAKLAKQTPRLAKLAKLAGGPVSNSYPSATVDDLMDHFRERAALMEYEGGLPRMRAVWLAELGVFVQTDERANRFDSDGNLLPRVDQVVLAIALKLVVTFHKFGRVVFSGREKEGGTT